MDPNKHEASLEKNEKQEHYGVHVEQADVDEGARFNLDRDLDPAEALRVRKKIDRHILPMMCGKFASAGSTIGYLMIYVISSALLVGWIAVTIQ
jgi:hypothetical protein